VFGPRWGGAAHRDMIDPGALHAHVARA
jgi:hypothetical protein